MRCGVSSPWPGWARRAPGTCTRACSRCRSTWPPRIPASAGHEPPGIPSAVNIGDDVGRTRSRIGGFLFLFLLILGAGGFFVWQQHLRFADRPMAGIESGDAVVVASGDNL